MFSKELNKILLFASDEAMRTGHKAVRSDHLMLGLLRQKDGKVAKTLESLGINLGEFKRMLDKSLFLKEPIAYDERANIQPSKDAAASLHAAVYESMKDGYKETQPEHLMLGLVLNTMCFTWIYLKEHRIGYHELKNGFKEPKQKSQSKRPGQEKILLSTLGEQLARISDSDTIS